MTLNKLHDSSNNFVMKTPKNLFKKKKNHSRKTVLFFWLSSRYQQILIENNFVAFLIKN